MLAYKMNSLKRRDNLFENGMVDGEASDKAIWRLRCRSTEMDKIGEGESKFPKPTLAQRQRSRRRDRTE